MGMYGFSGPRPVPPPVVFPAYSTVLASGSHALWELGDSITQGIGGTSGAGYRPELATWLQTTQGYTVTFDGTTNGPLGLHDGHPGFTLSDLRNTVANNYASHQHVGNIDLIVLMGGANNMNTVTAYDPVATPALYSALLNDCSVFTDTRIMVTTVTPHQGGSQQSAIIDFNSKLPAIWDAWDFQRPTNRLIRVDQFTAMGGAWSAGLFFDGVHPNPPGYTLIANEWIRGISTPM